MAGSWEDNHFFSFISHQSFSVKNNRIQLTSKYLEIKGAVQPKIVDDKL